MGNNTDYVFKTIKEVADELLTLPVGDSVDFTFDTPDDVLDETFEPSGWYGIKRLYPFDEQFGILLFGVYGGGCCMAEEIYEIKEIPEIIQGFCDAETGTTVKVLCVSTKHNGE